MTSRIPIRPENTMVGEPTVVCRVWSIAFMLLLLAVPGSGRARGLWYAGTLDSRVRVTLRQSLVPVAGSTDMTLYLAPYESTRGAINRQEVERYSLTCTPEPDVRGVETDDHGNRFDRWTWERPPPEVKCTVELDVALHVDLARLGELRTTPYRPRTSGEYLAGTDVVEQDEPELRALATKLARGTSTQFEVVMRVLDHVVDHVTYETRPASHSALHAHRTGRGNCQNYAHLASALLHTLGIEARVANGLSLGRPWRVPTGGGSTITFNAAQERHAWLEVRFPELGWISFDPQVTQFFVPHRHVRQTVGLDSPSISDHFVAPGRSARAPGDDSLRVPRGPGPAHPPAADPVAPQPDRGGARPLARPRDPSGAPRPASRDRS